MNFRIFFSDGSVYEAYNVVNRRKLWRAVSKTCKFLSTRVTKVERW